MTTDIIEETWTPETQESYSARPRAQGAWPAHYGLSPPPGEGTRPTSPQNHPLVGRGPSPGTTGRLPAASLYAHYRWPLAASNWKWGCSSGGQAALTHLLNRFRELREAHGLTPEGN